MKCPPKVRQKLSEFTSRWDCPYRMYELDYRLLPLNV